MGHTFTNRIIVADIATRWTRRTRLIAAGIAATTAATLFGLGGSAPASAASWQTFQLDRDGCWDMAAIDFEGNGYFNQVWYDLDNDCRWDTFLFDTNGNDSLLEWASFDMDENGRPEAWIQDSDQRVGYEWGHYDYDGDGWFDRTISMTSTTKVTSTAIDPQVNLLLKLAAASGTAAWPEPQR